MNDRRPSVERTALLLMLFSGAAALVFETVWLRGLERTFGVTVHAVSALVALYMAGLVLGSLAGARWARGRHDWLRLYALLELAACAAALAGSFAMRRMPAVVAAFGGAETPDLLLETLLRLSLAGPPLLLPTFFLGATLPVLCQAAPGRVGRLYAANTLGAALGALGTAFWMLGEWGETATLAFGAALQVAAAALALAASRRPAENAAPAPTAPVPPSPIYPLFALSGFAALGYEVLWSRQLIPLLGNSVYAFSLLLVAYLVGIAAGSALEERLKEEDPWRSFARLELLLAAAAFLSLWSTDVLSLLLDSPDYLYSPLTRLGDFPALAGRALLAVFPAAFVMGLLFPAAARVVSPAGAGGPVGVLYAANTAGGILGSLVAGFALIRLFGCHGAFWGLSALSAFVGLLALARARGPRLRRAELLLLLAVAAAGAGAWRDRGPQALLQRLRHAVGPSSLLFHDESPAGTATGVDARGERYLLINGILTSGVGLNGALMAVLPDVMLERPRAVLVICLGTGTTLRAALRLGAETVHAVELVDAVARNVVRFQPDLPSLLAGPGRKVFVEDGRSFLLRAGRRYDVIIVDASPPLYSAGAVNLYSRDFMEMARGRLSEEGVFTLWLPLFSFEEDYWRILSAAAASFPHIAVWNHPNIRGVLVFGSRRPFEWPKGAIDRRLKARVEGRVFGGLSEADVRSGFRVSEAELRDYLKRWPPVTDERPSVEFPLRRFLRREPFQKSTDFLLKASEKAR
ncbi:MAG: fused MFS/spermidine synthase [Elusimicrobiota bacterium]